MPAVLWAAFAFLVACHITGPVLDPDLWWHITVGRWTLAHGYPPTTDHWNMFGAGQPWRAYSWAPELLFALTDRWGGDTGLLVLQGAFAVAVVVTFMAVLGIIADDYFLGALLGAMVAAGCAEHFTLRPQLLVWIYAAVLLCIADRVTRVGSVSSGSYVRIALLGALWANTHLTTALGVALLFLWTLELQRPAVAVKTAAVFFLGTLITPYLGGEWLTFFSKTGHPLHYSAIAEFQPATILQFPTAFLLILSTLLATFLYNRPRLISPSQLVLAGLFVAGGLAVIKFIPFAELLLAALVCRAWRLGSPRSGPAANLQEAFTRLRAVLEYLPKEGLSFVFICLGLVQLYPLFEEPIHLGIVPVRAVDFIQKHNLPPPLLTEFGSGGYVMYRFSDDSGTPGLLVPIDGRTNVNRPDVWEAYHTALQGKADWKRFLDLVHPKTIVWRTGSAFVSLLRESPLWCEVFKEGELETEHSVFLSYELLPKFPDLASSDCQ